MSVTRFASTVSFDQARFNGPITFSEAIFDGPASFTSIHSTVAFSLDRTQFARTPDFIEATFHEPPRLDNVTIPKPLVRRRDLGREDPRGRGLFRRFAIAADATEHARFRKLRKMAADGKDHENEIRFNAHEIASRRFWVDRPWLFGPKASDGAGRFWVGWLYAKLSNYGQSLGRPLAAWLVCLVLAWPLYLAVPGAPLSLSPSSRGEGGGEGQQLAPPREAAPDRSFSGPPVVATDPDRDLPGRWFIRPWEFVGDVVAVLPALLPDAACHPSYHDAVRARDNGKATGPPLQPTSRFWQGLVLSFRNALVFDRSDVSRRMYGCLYGIQVKGDQDYPFIPTPVTVLSTLQSLVSAILLFLAGLGLRNMYRVK